MRIIYNRTSGILSESARGRLQHIFVQDAEATSRTLHDIFPHQLVQTRHGRTLVTKKDGSIILDILQDGSGKTNWVESLVNLKMTMK